MVRAQMLSELEEIIAYRQSADQPDRQQTMRKTWMKRYCVPFPRSGQHLTTFHHRVQGCQPDVEVWQRVLQVRSLVLKPDDDPVMWIKFANLCRKSDRMALAEKTIASLLPSKVRGCACGTRCSRPSSLLPPRCLRMFTNSMLRPRPMSFTLSLSSCGPAERDPGASCSCVNSLRA